MLSPLPRRSSWGLASLVSPSRISLPRKGDRVGMRIVLFEDCSAFTRVTACTLAKSPFVTRCIEGFSHFVTSMTSPITSGGSNRRVGLSPTGKAPPYHGAHPVLDVMLARVEELVRQSLLIAGPKEQEAWVRAQVAEDAPAYASATGTPNFRHR